MAKKATKAATKKTSTKKSVKKDAIDEQWKVMMKLLEKEEELLPELEPYRHTMYSITGFTHPLFRGMIAKEGCFAYINWQYRQVTKHLEKLRKEKKYLAAILMYDLPSLLDGFITEIEGADDKTFWTCLAAVWTNGEAPWANRKLFLQLFNAPRPHREYLMDADERKTFKKLPDELTIFRGFGGDRGKGLSWTLDREKAVWFAKRFHAVHGRPGRIIEGVCNKVDVIAHFTSRKESEIVIDPEKVRRQKRVPVEG